MVPWFNLSDSPIIFFLSSSLVSAPAVPCSSGHFSRTGLVPCYPCPRDYYQPEHGRSYCLSCPFYGTTTVTGASSIQHCSSECPCQSLAKTHTSPPFDTWNQESPEWLFWIIVVVSYGKTKENESLEWILKTNTWLFIIIQYFLNWFNGKNQFGSFSGTVWKLNPHVLACFSTFENSEMKAKIF